ncbi:MAG: dethiobiotin synthase, partial [Sulfurospirillaceae bacterium]|nr:dethiobiotin synthase [Sulfurospirillaceae bacterium]
MSLKPIFITATNTDVGKTYTALKLIKALSLQGLHVGIFKPIETGVIEDKPLDGVMLWEEAKKHNPKMQNLTIGDIVPYRFCLSASPYVAKGDTQISL